MNEAKEFSSLEKFLERDDKRIAEQLEKTLVEVNVLTVLMQADLRKLIHERMR